MSQLAERIRFWYQELRRRRVLRVAAVYGAVGWAIVEIAATTFPLLHLPEWTATLVLVLVLLGFPLTVALAWVFDLTPEGVRRTESGGTWDEGREGGGPVGQPGARGLVPRDDDADAPTRADRGETGGWVDEVFGGEPAVRSRRGRRWALAAIGVALVTAAAAFGYRLAATPEDANPRVMVLPFENRTGDESLDALGQMAADWVSNGLLEIPEIDVVPHALLMEALEGARGQHDGGEATVLEQVAGATGADIGVTGAFYRRQDALEFHTEVLDVTTSQPMAVIDPVRGPADDPVQGIDSVQIQVMGALAARLAPRVAWELPPSAQPPTYRAYLAYTNGLDAWIVGDYGGAARWFEEAFARDTTYLRALMFAWSAHGNSGNQARSDSLEAFLRARREDLPRYDLYRLDWSYARRHGDHRAALAAARSAMELNPTGTLRLGLGLSLRDTNRPEEARKQFEDWLGSMHVASWYGIWTNYARILHMLGDYEVELDVARRERDRLPAGQLLLGEAEARALVALGQMGPFQRRLVELEALSSGLARDRLLHRLALELRAHGHREASVDLADRAIAWHDDLPEELRQGREGRTARAALAYVGERWSEAAGLWAALEEDAEVADLVDAVGTRGAAAARLDDRPMAEASIRRLTTLVSSPSSPPGAALTYRARMAAVLGERQQAVELLRQAFVGGQAFGIWLHRDMDLEALRGYPPYEQLVQPEG